MSRPSQRRNVEQQVLNLLAANPKGLSSPRLRTRLKPHLSQPTLSRLLLDLRAHGKVAKTGSARATRYHLAGGRIAAGELRSRLLHEQVAERLVRDPSLKQRAIDRLEILRKANPHGRRYHERWAELLESDMHRLLRAMTEDSEQAAALRRESPFTTLFDANQRRALFKPALKAPRHAIARLCRRHHVRRLSLFGSTARGDSRPDSDVDLLVEFDPTHTPGLGEMAELREGLSKLFEGRRVDLATPAVLKNPYRRASIERDLETVYATR